MGRGTASSIEVKGLSSHWVKIPLWRRLFALILDLIILFTIGVFLFDHLASTMTPGTEFSRPDSLLKMIAGGLVGSWIVIRLSFKRSPAHALLGFRSVEGQLRFRGRNRKWSSRLVTFLGILLVLGVAPLYLLGLIRWSPLFQSAEELVIPPSVVTPEAQAEWSLLPYAYTTAPWPKQFHGAPIFVSIPYQKGPPVQFVDRIQLRWEMPDLFITVEGPKSPKDRAKPQELRAALQVSVENDYQKWNESFHLRFNALQRHLHEMRTAGFEHLSTSWFKIEGSEVGRPEGFVIHGDAGTHYQDRYVVVTPEGIHQAFWIDRPGNERGHEALQLFKKVLGGMVVNDHLPAQRAIIEQRLREVNLNQSPPETNSEAFVARMAEVQNLLTSKISADPKDYDAYFHLAGTSIVLARHFAQRKTASESASPPTLQMRELLKSMVLYATDLNPSDPRTGQLESFRLEAAKY